MRSAATVCSLGRNGDVLTGLEIARHLGKSTPVRFLTCKEYVPLLDGVSYAAPVAWAWDYSKLPDAIHWLKRHGISKAHIAQSYCHPDARKDCSYQEDAYRLAGFPNLFGSLPLVFDRRNREREWKLMENIPVGRPWIAISTQGISSPCPSLKDLIPELVQQYPEYEIVDLSTLKAVRLFDMLGVLDGCSLLVSIDTVWLHLARASHCPVIAIVNDLENWRASVPPPATVAKFGYKTVSTEMVVEAVGKFLEPKTRNVFLSGQIFGMSERHQKALRSWKKLKDRGAKMGVALAYPRNFEEEGRQLPFLKEILSYTLELMTDDDVLVWVNSDVQVRMEAIDWAKNHAGTYGACSMRRNEEGHVGRELLAFRGDWLKKYWKEIPDYCIGAPVFDIGMAAFIREKVGVKSTLENMAWDFHPADSDKRYALHEPHESSWKDDSPSAQYNRSLFNRWIEEKGWKFW